MRNLTDARPLATSQSSFLHNFLLPTNLRWLVDEADGRADHRPLDEVGDALVER
jgi:hypothetical protein